MGYLSCGFEVLFIYFLVKWCLNLYLLKLLFGFGVVVGRCNLVIMYYYLFWCLIYFFLIKDLVLELF